MKNLLNFFFSFDKLFKEKLIVPAFWLAIIYYGLRFLVEAIDAVHLDPLNWIIGPVTFFAKVIFTLLAIRIVAELAVAVFRINNNLSPDKGRSETADIDPVAEARKAAEAAAARTREMTASATEKTKNTFGEVKTSVGDTTSNLTSKASAATAGLAGAAGLGGASAKAKTEAVMGKGSVPEAGEAPTPVKALEPSAADAPAVVKRGRGRPKGSKNKPKTGTQTGTASTAASSTTAKRGPGRPKGSKNKPKSATANATPTTAKRGPGRPKGSKNKPKPAGTTATTKRKPGPKPGTKVLRDADGNLLKKDGTPRKKPGPKPKS